MCDLRPLAFALAAALRLAGCGSTDAARANLVPTTGHVSLNGKPASGAILVFHPADNAKANLPPRARVGSDGRFTVQTSEVADGLPEGDYTVTIDWRTGGDEETATGGSSLIASKYARRETTDVKVTVRASAEGRCELAPILLKK